jgi:hypothetical protein
MTCAHIPGKALECRRLKSGIVYRRHLCTECGAAVGTRDGLMRDAAPGTAPWTPANAGLTTAMRQARAARLARVETPTEMMDDVAAYAERQLAPVYRSNQARTATTTERT